MLRRETLARRWTDLTGCGAAGERAIADDYFPRIRRCTPGGTIRTVAGFVDPEGTGPLDQARLWVTDSCSGLMLELARGPAS